MVKNYIIDCKIKKGMYVVSCDETYRIYKRPNLLSKKKFGTVQDALYYAIKNMHKNIIYKEGKTTNE